MTTLFELSYDNYIEIRYGQCDSTSNVFCTIEEAVEMIANRNFNMGMDLYQNPDVAEVLGTHHTINDLKDIIRRWDKGYDYDIQSDVQEYRLFLTHYIDMLYTRLSSW